MLRFYGRKWTRVLSVVPHELRRWSRMSWVKGKKFGLQSQNGRFLSCSERFESRRSMHNSWLFSSGKQWFALLNRRNAQTWLQVFSWLPCLCKVVLEAWGLVAFTPCSCLITGTQAYLLSLHQESDFSDKLKDNPLLGLHGRIYRNWLDRPDHSVRDLMVIFRCFSTQNYIWQFVSLSWYILNVFFLSNTRAWAWLQRIHNTKRQIIVCVHANPQIPARHVQLSPKTEVHLARTIKFWKHWSLQASNHWGHWHFACCKNWNEACKGICPKQEAPEQLIASTGACTPDAHCTN